MEFIQSLIDDNSVPVLTAFLLGLIVALHPCPLAANVAAMGYLANAAPMGDAGYGAPVAAPT